MAIKRGAPTEGSSQVTWVLNSGGPNMTVEAVQSDGTLRCVWFHEDGKQDHGVFAQVALRAAKTKN